MNTNAPPKTSIAYLNYSPWNTTNNMREYCSNALQLFKPIVAIINSPLQTLSLRAFTDLVSQEIELLAPIAKTIQQDPFKYNAFEKFPIGIKIFINCIIQFIGALGDFQQSNNSCIRALLAVNQRKDELSQALKMVLSILRKLIECACQP